eukprot:tig00001388_g8572.t1
MLEQFAPIDHLDHEALELGLPRSRSSSSTPPFPAGSSASPVPHAIGSPGSFSNRCASPVLRDASGRSVFSRPRSFWNKKQQDPEHTCSTAERTSLMRAAEEGDLTTIEELLRDETANVNETNSAGVSAVVYAARAEQWAAVRLLASRGADVDACSKMYRKTPLIWASKAGDLDTVRFLLDRGASVTHRDVDHMTAALVAADATHWEAVWLLLDRGADVNVKPSQDKKTLLMMAAIQANAEAIRGLCVRGAKVDIAQVDGITPLMYAAYVGDVESVRALIEAGANVNHKDRNGTTVLFWAISHGGSDEVVRVLLEKGSDGNEKAEVVQLAPISMAAKIGRFDVVSVLAECGAEVDAKDEDGCTPLMIAAAAGAHEAVRALLDAGASHEESDDVEQTALHHACEPIPGCPIDTEVVRMLLEAGADGDAEDERQLRPLHRACAAACPDAVRLLLEAGAEVDAQDGEGRTPLLFACKLRHLAAAAEVAGLLLEAGADASAGDCAGKTPLMAAAKRNNTRLIRMLCDAGADTDTKDWRSDTAVLIAARLSKWEALKELAACGADVNAAEHNVAGVPRTPGTPAPSPAEESLLARAADLPRRQQRALLERGFSFCLPDRSQGRTALMYCAEHGDAATVRGLLRRGADPQRTTSAGWSAIEFCKRGRRERLERRAPAPPRPPLPSSQAHGAALPVARRAMSRHAEEALQHARPGSPLLHRIPSSGVASVASPLPSVPNSVTDLAAADAPAPAQAPRDGPPPPPPPPSPPRRPRGGAGGRLAERAGGRPLGLLLRLRLHLPRLLRQPSFALPPPPPPRAPRRPHAPGLPPHRRLQGLAVRRVSPSGPPPGSPSRSRRLSTEGSRASSASPARRPRRVPSLSDLRALLFPTLVNAQLEAKPAGPVAARRRRCSVAYIEHAASPRNHELEPPSALSDRMGRANRRRSLNDATLAAGAPPDDAEAAAIMEALQRAIAGQLPPSPPLSASASSGAASPASSPRHRGPSNGKAKPGGGGSDREEEDDD